MLFRSSKIRGETVDLINTATNEMQYIPMHLLRKNFIFAYCYTCHSVQGSSIDDSITIFDYKHWLVNKEWLWTAITRARDLNKVKFYKYSDDKNDVFNKRCVFTYFSRKVQGYKEQDRAGKRKIENNTYIDENWLLEKLNSCCSRCGIEFSINLDKGSIYSNLTAQRINNEMCHIKSNCLAYCKRCNCSASNREKI